MEEKLEETLLAEFATMLMEGSTTKMFPLSSTGFPDEILIDILARLPVKTLIRFRCVSKPWYSLIGGSPFFTEHLEHTRLRNRRSSTNNNDNEDSHILLIPPPSSRDPCQLLCEKTYVEQATVENPYETKSRGWGKFEVLGPCNGTVALVNFALVNFDIACRFVYMHMWNPIIGHFKTIPPLRCYATAADDIFVFGFGYEESTNDYKIVKFVDKQEDPSPSGLIQVYSLRTDRWKNIEVTNANVVPALAMSSPAAHNGFIHWMAMKTTGEDKKRKETIMRFDVGEELFGEMECPVCWDTTQGGLLVSLGVANDSLCAIVKTLSHNNNGDFERCEIWVMIEYGVGESWSKQYGVVFDRGISDIFGLTVNGKLMCSSRDEESQDQWLVIHDPKTSGYNLIKKFRSIHLWAFFSFTESLVLLDYCQI